MSKLRIGQNIRVWSSRHGGLHVSVLYHNFYMYLPSRLKLRLNIQAPRCWCNLACTFPRCTSSRVHIKRGVAQSTMVRCLHELTLELHVVRCYIDMICWSLVYTHVDCGCCFLWGREDAWSAHACAHVCMHTSFEGSRLLDRVGGGRYVYWSRIAFFVQYSERERGLRNALFVSEGFQCDRHMLTGYEDPRE